MYVGYQDVNNVSNFGGDPVTQLNLKNVLELFYAVLWARHTIAVTQPLVLPSEKGTLARWTDRQKGTLARWTDRQKGTLAQWTDRQKGTLARWTEEKGHN